MSSPEQILKKLDSLWLSMGKSEPDGADAVLRACALTLVTAGWDDDPGIGETLALVVRDHPSRLIVLNVTDQPGDHLHADVTAQCWMPFGRRQQICCEQILLTSSVASLDGAAALVRSLIVPDLPVALWCRSEKLFRMREFRPVAEQAAKVIIDSTGVTDLAGPLELLEQGKRDGRKVADLAWTRLTPWRESIARRFDHPGASLPEAIERVRITYQGAHLPIEAVYLAAWLENSLPRSLKLDWIPVSGHGGVEQVALCDGAMEYTAKALGERTPDELLREELAVAGHDAVFEAALATAVRIVASL